MSPFYRRGGSWNGCDPDLCLVADIQGMGPVWLCLARHGLVFSERSPGASELLERAIQAQ